uniref:hypothetical protein n=1 Tax=Microbulbifer agarilyticus TaxID=260552 RepID=UPI00052457E2|nr:hypothetical protein [Microbulbifer agarilyticus]
MKVIVFIILAFPPLSWASVIPSENQIVQPKECGYEQRSEHGYLLPLAVMDSIEIQCTDCYLELTFDVPANGGFPEKVVPKFSGVSSSEVQKTIEVFSNGWAFPYCVQDGAKSGFEREMWRFVGPA